MDKFFEIGGFFFKVAGRGPFHALEKNVGLLVLMLIGVMNVTAPQEYPTRDSRHQTGLVGAVQECDDGFLCLGHSFRWFQDL